MVDRYKMTVSNVTATAHGAAHPEGEYVLWRDYEALRAEVERLTREVHFLRLYGNKDCTAMADEAMARDADPTTAP